MFFIIYQLENYWSIIKLSCRPLTLNSYKAFLKNKNRSGKTLCFIFYKFLEKKRNSVIFYYLSPDLKFPPPSKKILLFLAAKFYFNPYWGYSYNMLFFSFKKGLNGQNHSSSDSHHHIKISLLAKFPCPQWADIPEFLTGVENMGSFNRYMGRRLGWGWLKCCWKISVKEFIR